MPPSRGVPPVHFAIRRGRSYIRRLTALYCSVTLALPPHTERVYVQNRNAEYRQARADIIADLDRIHGAITAGDHQHTGIQEHFNFRWMKRRLFFNNGPSAAEEGGAKATQSKDSETIAVWAHIEITSLVEVDPVRSVFTCDCRLSYFWRPTPATAGGALFEELCEKAKTDENPTYGGYKLSAVEYESLVKERGLLLPNVYFHNQLTEVVGQDSQPLTLYNIEHLGIACQMHNRFYADLKIENCDMRLFPFDQQVLPIKLYCGNDDNFKLHVHCVQYRPTTFNIPGWRLGRPVVYQWDKGPKANVMIGVERRYEHYVNSLMLYLAMLNLLALSAHAIPAEDVGDRLSVLFTLLLVVIAFRYTMGNDVPKLSYSTLMDSFLGVNTMSVTLSIVVVAIGDVAELSEWHMLVACAAITLVSFIVWALIFWLWLSSKRQDADRVPFDPAKKTDLNVGHGGTAAYLFGKQPYFLTPPTSHPSSS